MPRGAPGGRILSLLRAATFGRRGPSRALAVLALAAAVVNAPLPIPVAAQLSSPCELTCGLVLGATGFTTATGALVAWGRTSGGVSNISEVAGVWGGTFLVFVGGGIALSGNGERQERAVYVAGIGALAGSLVGFAVASALDGGDRARKVAGALIGAAAGAVVGGVYGALSQDDEAGGGTPLLQMSVPF